MILYDISTKKHFSNIKDKNIEMFVQSFFQKFQDISLKDELIISYICQYVNSRNIIEIDEILCHNCDRKIMYELEKKYFNSFNSIELIKEYDKAEHINFTNKIIKNPNLYFKYNNIWLNDLIHLNREAFSEVFITGILQDIGNKID